MQFFHQWPFATPIQAGCATIGNFDGMHLGHQTILQQLKLRAAELGLASTVILFEPQPQEFFQQNNAPARLQRLSDKITFLKAFGIDQVVCLSFNTQLANATPQFFVETILLQHLQVKCLLVGQDFKFGKARGGDVEFLKKYQSQFKLEIIHDIACSEAGRISSTRIREALALGNFGVAKMFLGRAYTITGKVVHGAKRGRQLQFPTANIALLRYKSPLYGVYAVQCHINETLVPGVANIGCRPTVHDVSAWYLEVHLLDHQGWQLYGQRLQIEFVQKIRDEMKFASLEALQSQITKDVEVAKGILNVAFSKVPI